MKPTTIPSHVLANIPNECKHYCVITRGGKVISTGYNTKSSITYRGHEFRDHAEISAIRSLIKNPGYQLKVV